MRIHGEDLFIVHCGGKIGGIYTSKAEAEELAKTYLPQIRSAVLIQHPEEYGDWCMEMGKKMQQGYEKWEK